MNNVKGKIWQTRTETGQPSFLPWTPMPINGHASQKKHQIVMSVTFQTILYYKGEVMKYVSLVRYQKSNRQG